MTSFRKIAVPVTCVIAICGVALLWPVYKQKSIERKLAEAAKECRVRAEQGDADSQSSLGKMYYDGKGVPRDYGEAVRWFRKAADQGYAKAQHNLGVSYYRGHGVLQDYAEAVHWYTEAAEQGNESAQSSLGGMYVDGRGVPKDYVRAHMWLNLAAARSSGDLQREIAVLRDMIGKDLTVEQLSEAQRLAREWKPRKQVYDSGGRDGQR